VEELVPATLPTLRRRDVVKHAWGHIRESWRTALAGALVTAVLPPLFKWWDTYHFSQKGLNKVTSGDWTDSMIAVGVWLALVAVWHLWCAPMGHAREVINAHRHRHVEEIDRAREEAKGEASKPSIGQYVHQQIVVATPEQAAELVQRVPGVEARPADVRPAQRGELQTGEDAADDQAGGTGQTPNT
jgi:hypothetical protein